MANIKIEKKDSFRIEYTKGDTYALKLTFKNVDQDLTSAIFTVKENHEDETPLIEKTKGAGITKLDENFYKRELVYKLQLQATDSQFLETDHLYLYDLKIAVGNVVKTVIKGNFVVTYNVTSVDRMTTEIVDIEIDDAIDTDAETTPATHGIEYETDPIATAQIGNMSTLSTTAKDTLVNAINEIEPKASSALEEITNIENGTVTVPNATHATNADNATTADSATTAENAIKNNDNTYSGFTADANGVLKVGDEIITKKRLLWSGNQSVNYSTEGTISLGNIQVNAGSKFEVEVEFAHKGLLKYTLPRISGAISVTNIHSISDASGIIYKLAEYRFCFNTTTSNSQTYITSIVFDCLRGLEFSTSQFTGEYTPSDNENFASIRKIYEIIE